MKEKTKILLRRIKTMITIVIIVGVAIHLFMVYDAAKSIKIVDKKIIGVYPNYLEPDEYDIKFMLSLKNPKKTTIEIDYIKYKVYVEDEFLGEGEKPRFFIQHGTENYTFLFTFNIMDLVTPVKNILMKGEVNITVKGDTIIPAKFLGLFTWKYIDLPYEINEKVKIPI
ncbi:MAG: LEA type 2 family protein [Thermoplasmata archaeon]|nr:MAG: LEA type 2 family protein [Thermoplasmata archaeon]